jgi:hypothetical protein
MEQSLISGYRSKAIEELRSLWVKNPSLSNLDNSIDAAIRAANSLPLKPADREPYAGIFSTPKSKSKDILLPCGWFPQTDNLWRSPRLYADNTCSCSSTTALIDHYRPELKLTDDEYIKTFHEGRYGDTTDHNAHVTCAQEAYGVITEFTEEFTFDLLNQELEANRIVILAFLHRGSRHNPSGGHVSVCRGVTSDRKGYWFMDPYGSMNDGYQGPVENGKCVLYLKEDLQTRWYSPPGYPSGGYARIFKGLTK